MRRAKLFLFVLLSIGAGCGGGSIPPVTDPTARIEKADDYLRRGKEREALETYRIIVGAYPGTEWEERARLGIARSYRSQGDYPAAVLEYQDFQRRHPRSEFVDDAAYEIGLCYAEQRKKPQLDQEWNEKALEQFNSFLARFPDSDLAEQAREKRLEARTQFARKTIQNGVTYRKLRRFTAARFYFQIVLDEYPDTPLVPEAIYEIARSHEGQKDYAAASEAYRKLAEEYPGSDWAEKGEKRLKEIGRRLEEEAEEDS
ncbi:MAG: outer membrane protein assembly factor BamD [Candidatus Eisenbacteria bacterium]|nr:outer membrane protein assembly factor BamD [Candidatus Eisenbacteria bacterium]